MDPQVLHSLVNFGGLGLFVVYLWNQNGRLAQTLRDQLDVFRTELGAERSRSDALLAEERDECAGRHAVVVGEVQKVQNGLAAFHNEYRLAEAVRRRRASPAPADGQPAP